MPDTSSEIAPAVLRRMFDDGRRAWPEVALSYEAFARHIGARAAGRESPHASHAGDVFLACACAARARGAVEAFERAYVSRVAAYLAGMRPTAAFLDEVRQVLREKLFVGKEGGVPKIAEYDGRGALESWVRVIALRTAIDLKRRSKTRDGASGEADQHATGDPEVDYVKRRYRRAFNDAFARAVTALSSSQREILRLHFVDGLTLDQLAVELGVHRATVARRVAAARTAAIDEARRLLREALGATDAELASLARLMQSQLDLSLPRLLKDG
jgi:RNA polymerase sigma-70 factor (ECF subfamily)